MFGRFGRFGGFGGFGAFVGGFGEALDVCFRKDRLLYYSDFPLHHPKRNLILKWPKGARDPETGAVAKMTGTSLSEDLLPLKPKGIQSEKRWFPQKRRVCAAPPSPFLGPGATSEAPPMAKASGRDRTTGNRPSGSKMRKGLSGLRWKRNTSRRDQICFFWLALRTNLLADSELGSGWRMCFCIGFP